MNRKKFSDPFILFYTWQRLRNLSKELYVRVHIMSIHRRTGNFLPGGGGGAALNHLPKKLLQVAQIFTKQSNRNEGHTMQRA